MAQALLILSPNHLSHKPPSRRRKRRGGVLASVLHSEIPLERGQLKRIPRSVPFLAPLIALWRSPEDLDLTHRVSRLWCGTKHRKAGKSSSKQKSIFSVAPQMPHKHLISGEAMEAGQNSLGALNGRDGGREKCLFARTS
jgi:hypothetical protein